MAHITKTVVEILVALIVGSMLAAVTVLWAKDARADGRDIYAYCHQGFCTLKQADLAVIVESAAKCGVTKVKVLSSHNKTSYANSTAEVNQAAPTYRGALLLSEKTNELEYQSCRSRQREVEGSGASCAVQGRGHQPAQRGAEAGVRSHLLGDRPSSDLSVAGQGLRSEDRWLGLVRRAGLQREGGHGRRSDRGVADLSPVGFTLAGLFEEKQ